MIFSISKMAISIQNSDSYKNSFNKRLNNAIWTIKLLLFLTAFIAIFVSLKIAMPYCFNLVFSILPRFFFSLRALLSPPYLYIIVNCIILTIAASSSFSWKLNEKNREETVIQKRQEQKASPDDILRENSCLTDDPGGNPPLSGEKSLETLRQPGAEKCVESMPINSCMTEHSGYNLPVPGKEKQPATVRFGSKKGEKHLLENNRRSVKPSPDGSSLGVPKQRKYDTLDATWRKITEGRAVPLNRHLKKCDTWESAPRLLRRAEAEPELLSGRREFKKSETFDDASSASSGPATSARGARRERSLSQDELNRRVEAFIKKFNDDIRLQRQESYTHYVEMVNRGIH